MSEKEDVRVDGWSNLFTGFGTSADKRRETRSRQNLILSDIELDSIYTDDGLGARIVDLLPDDMTRQGWEFRFDDEKEGFETYAKKYEEAFDALNATSRLTTAMKWARLYGGSLLIIGALDGSDFSEPLDGKRVRALESLRVVPLPDVELDKSEWNGDSTSPRFGQIERYAVKTRFGFEECVMLVHRSRVVEFHGLEIPTSGNGLIPAKNRHFGVPVLQRVYERLGDLGAIFGSLSVLMQESSVGKYKFENLADILSNPEGGKMIQNRVQVMDLMKSVFHSVYMDSNDDFLRDNVSFGGISDVLYQFFVVISACTGYPMTRLFGVSPAGLNASGDSDTYSYYDMVRARQVQDLKPALSRIAEIVGAVNRIPIPRIEFNPLEQMTEKEKSELDRNRAEAERMKAETYQRYMDMGVMEPYHVEELEFGDTLRNITGDLP